MLNRSPREFGGQKLQKSYDFVSFPDKVVRHEVPGHCIIRPDLHNGTLEFNFRTLTPAFVSSGQPALGEDLRQGPVRVIQAHYRIGGRIAIPGSSLKGAVRSVAEAVSASCMVISRASHRELPDAVQVTCSPRAACPACILFGMGGRGKDAYLGHVHFHDTILHQGGTKIFRLPALFRPRPESPFYRKGPRQFKGRKFYKHYRPNEASQGGESEVILPGSLLAGKIEFTNLAEDQLGLLLYSLGCDEHLQLKLGGGKPKGLGSLETEPKRLTLNCSRENFLGNSDKTSTLIYENTGLIKRVRELITSARQSDFFVNKQADELEKLLHFDPDTLEDVPFEGYFSGGRRWS